MKLKSLFLGAGAVLAVAAPAAAADLSFAEPVDYVRVCDAFGTGYWYIPGTDTCIKIGGYVRFDVRGTDGKYVSNDHTAQWNFRTRARLNFWATSQTEYGALSGFVRLQGNFDNTSSTNGQLAVDRAYITFGQFLFGHESSLFDYSVSYGVDAGGYRSDQAVDQVRWTHKFDKLSLALSIEDPQDRHGSLAPIGAQHPDIIAALTYSEGPFSAKLSGAFIDKWAGTSGVAAQFGAALKLDQIAKGDAIRFLVGYGKDAGSFTGALKTLGSTYAAGTSWNAAGSAIHYWRPDFSTALTGSYVTATNGTTASAWQAAISAAWTPAKGVTFGSELNFVHNSTKSKRDSWTALGRVIREF